MILIIYCLGKFWTLNDFLFYYTFIQKSRPNLRLGLWFFNENKIVSDLSFKFNFNEQWQRTNRNKIWPTLGCVFDTFKLLFFAEVRSTSVQAKFLLIVLSFNVYNYVYFKVHFTEVKNISCISFKLLFNIHTMLYIILATGSASNKSIRTSKTHINAFITHKLSFKSKKR